jgi:HlyD family secretion protein
VFARLTRYIGHDMNYEPKFSDFGEKLGTDEDHSRANGLPRWLIWLVVGLAALAIVFFAWRAMQPEKPVVGAKSGGASAGSSLEKQAPKVTVVVPGRQLVENIVTATGTLAAQEDMPVGAAGEGGQVLRVLVQPGSWVRQGQVLAVVDRQVQIQQANQVASQIAAAQADSRLAQSELDRANTLAGRGFISKADLQRKAAARDASHARVHIAQAQLAELRARMGRLDIKAPANGYVLSRSIEPGQIVGPGGAVLFRIARGGKLELKADVGEADLLKMSVGRPVQVTPVGTDSVFNGSIWQITPTIDPQSRQGAVRVALPFDRSLRPGGFASARIVSGSVFAPLLPESAVQADKGVNYVYIVDADGKVRRVDVKVGAVNERGASILEGLTGNEKIVVSAGGFLNPGELVRPEFLKK